MSRKINPEKITLQLAWVIGLLLGAHLVGAVSVLHFGISALSAPIQLFDFNQERNFPTLFSALLMGACSILLMLLGRQRKEQGAGSGAWYFLGGVMLFLAVDEIIPLHESTVGPIRRAIYSRPELFDALRAVIRNGTLFHAILNRGWVIPYTAIAMAAAAFLRIAKTLSKKNNLLIVCAAALYIGGAVGLELLGEVEIRFHGVDTPLYLLISTLEELFEKLGMLVFLYALLDHIRETSPHLAILFTNENSAAPDT